MKLIIVGAGLTGLILGKSLNQKLSKDDRVLLFEKSRGVGGRMATRRTDTAKFDHGAQFYARREPLENLHQEWSAKSITRYWLDRKETPHFAAPGGMTALAKDLAEGLEIHYEKRVTSLEQIGNEIRVHLDTGEAHLCDRLVLTAPLPQSLEILRKIDLQYPAAMDGIQYSKALVGLVELNSASTEFAGPSGYLEFTEGNLFSIANQGFKKVSHSSAYTVTLSEKTSEDFYESSDETVADLIRREIHHRDPKATVDQIQIKRWRYNRPLSTYGELYCEVSSSLILAGDAFGGASLNGAARSARAVANFLLTVPS